MRCSHTAWPFLTGSVPSQLNVKIIEKQQMSEINPGVWDGLTPEQVITLLARFTVELMQGLGQKILS
jgi:hypothetical protein